MDRSAGETETQRWWQPFRYIWHVRYFLSFQLNGETLLFASEIIQRAVHQVDVIANNSEQLDTFIVATAMDGCGNVLGAASSQEADAEGAQNLPEVVEITRQSIHSLLKVSVITAI